MELRVDNGYWERIERIFTFTLFSLPCSLGQVNRAAPLGIVKPGQWQNPHPELKGILASALNPSPSELINTHK
jgi:hypothetical protein